MRYVAFIFAQILIVGVSHGQCSLRISGQVVDQGTEIPLAFSNIFLEETGAGTVTDSLGNFVLEGICAGKYHLRVSHIGCKPQELFFTISQDTSLHVHLAHHRELLDEVVVHGHRSDNTSQSSSTLSRDFISQESGRNLTELLESITGVRALESGSGISKPIIHGLYGNRITILNNGVPQAGQQWGNDHAPEIDPFVADHISVIKGVSALEYGGNALGGVVLIETAPVPADPHLHGEVNYTLQSNGWGHAINSSFEKKGKWASWRATGTVKLRGDTKAPDYFLSNTGQREGNLALQVEREMNPNWKMEAYYSLFNTQIGILRGSHIGNLTDLQEAIVRTTPFFTKDDFSYDISEPRQDVAHHLLKFVSRHFLTDERVLTLTYGGQLNQRKEFDVRRSGRSDIPALSLDQVTHLFSGTYSTSVTGKSLLKTGLQFEIEDNTNDAETGIFPLIPDYRFFNTGAFGLFKTEGPDWIFETGVRYDYRYLNVVRITRTTPPQIERIDKQFHNFSISTGFRWRTLPSWENAINIGLTSRTPEVNELYSSGLHQGVSGIEEGTSDLSREQSVKITLSSDLNIGSSVFIQALGYYQRIDDYIFLQPQQDFRLTIRGAFPVFLYAQEDATIKGLDLLFKYEPNSHVKFVSRYAMLRGKGQLDRPLVNMPSDDLFVSTTITFPGKGRINNPYLSLNGEYVFEQTRLDPDQDFKAPPGDYFLLGASAGLSLQLGESHLDLNLSIENALNTTYRNYLNRLRYFADDTGMNLRFRAHYHF